MTALLLILASNGSGRVPCMAWAGCVTKRSNLLIVGERSGKSSSFSQEIKRVERGEGRPYVWVAMIAHSAVLLSSFAVYIAWPFVLICWFFYSLPHIAWPFVYKIIETRTCVRSEKPWMLFIEWKSCGDFA
uniref:Uncharacterized protein n=1 Tax=Aegilops tauschii subsp. strangulata TaxID=200361 RepID=A0A453KPL5_AEGTS